MRKLTAWMIVDNSGSPDPAALNKRGMPRLFPSAEIAVDFCFRNCLNELSGPAEVKLTWK